MTQITTSVDVNISDWFCDFIFSYWHLFLERKYFVLTTQWEYNAMRSYRRTVTIRTNGLKYTLFCVYGGKMCIFYSPTHYVSCELQTYKTQSQLWNTWIYEHPVTQTMTHHWRNEVDFKANLSGTSHCVKQFHSLIPVFNPVTF